MANEKFRFPGIRASLDGSEAVAYIETNISDAACCYPITPSTNMPMFFQRAVADGKKNIWGMPITLIETESEHSSASACEGVALAGGRVTNFTCSQGLLLMKEQLYVMSGKRLPVVFHIGARTLTSQALCIHAGHDDVMGCADIGWGTLFAKNNQEILDLALIARKAAEDSETPFMVVQDGFFATHTVESCLLPETDLMKQYVGAPSEKIRNIFDPERGLLIGCVQNQDAYMKGKIAQRYFYDRIPEILQKDMNEYFELTGRRYSFTEGFLLDDADYIIVGMGTLIETAEAVAQEMRKKGIKVGTLGITSFRPFPATEIVKKLGKAKAITVVERCDIPLAQSNPLTCEIKSAFADAINGAPDMPKIKSIPQIYNCVAGLGSRDIGGSEFVSIIENMRQKQGRRFSVVGIIHPAALPKKDDIDLRSETTFCLRGHSIGGMGSITTAKVLASILNDAFELNVQTYPKFGAEKRGMPTSYFLGYSDKHIKFHCEFKNVNFVDVVDPNAFKTSNPLDGLDKGGIVLIHTESTPKEVWNNLPELAKRTIRDKKIKLYTLETAKIIREVTQNQELATRLKGIALVGAFLKLSPLQKKFGYSEEQVFVPVENALRRAFGKKGEAIIKLNVDVVKKAYHSVKSVPIDEEIEVEA